MSNYNKMTYFNIIGDDCETIIYQYMHQLNFMECMKEIKKIEHFKIYGCGGIAHTVRRINGGEVVEYKNDYEGFSAERKRSWNGMGFGLHDYITRVCIYPFSYVFNNESCIGGDEYYVDSGFAEKEEMEEVKNNPCYVEIDEDNLYIMKRSFYVTS